jgi:hypothetical protein
LTGSPWRARRVLGAAALSAAVAAALAVSGRAERRHWIDDQLHGMVRVERLVGLLDQRSLTGFRVSPQFDCLVYRRGPNPYALELCVDHQGRVVQAIDRTGPTRRYYDLHADPAAATLRLDRDEVERLLAKMGALAAR